MKPSIFILFIACCTMAFQCGKPTDPCSNAICTEELRSFNIVTCNAQGKPIVPEQLRVVNVSTGNAIISYTQNTKSAFTVFSDGDAHLIPSRNIATSVAVQAIQNNVVAATVTLQFSKDCCHVTKVSGVDTLFIP
jgi:hypothetical protein